MNNHFKLVRSHAVDALNIVFQEYQHTLTQARHIHLKANDNNNVFLVSFLTVPQDSTGVAHILEHTALCGSKHYPVRDPFFMMIRRSLNTFMNAFTAADWTAYPFASQNKKDFYNLLDVYLDAAFFPNLDALDFAQEGHRLEFDDDQQLVFKGVVFNEMKGAMSAPTAQLEQLLSHSVFPTTTYHHNSGGDPACIVDLTHAELKAFHAKHYHPSNALFFTYGDLDPLVHQAVFEEKVLAHFSHQAMDFSVPDEQRYTQPHYVSAPYTLPETESLAQKTHIVLSWLLNPIADAEQTLRARVMSSVLLDNASSPLRHALESSGLGQAPSPFCGMDDNPREAVFMCGVEGSEPEQADAVEALILSTLQRIVDEGVPQQQIESVLHQIELASREISGDHYPYGLKLVLDCLAPCLHGGDPLQALHVDLTLNKIRTEISDPQFIPRLIQTLLLDNSHRVRVVLTPNHGLAQQQTEREQARLQAIAAQLDDAAVVQIKQQSEALKQRQAQEDDPEILPRVTRADIPAQMTIPQPVSAAHAPMTIYTPVTNGMVYQQLLTPLPELTEQEWAVLPLFNALLTQVGSGGRDYLATQAVHAQLTGGLSAKVLLRGGMDQVQQTQGCWVLSGKALSRHQGELAHLLHETLYSAQFQEHARLKELIAQARSAREERIVDAGHTHAMSVAAQWLSPLAKLNQRWDGMLGIQALRQLDLSLKNDTAAMEQLSEQLTQLLLKLQTQLQTALVVCDARDQLTLTQCLSQTFPNLGAIQTDHALNLPARDHPQQQVGWAINAAVQYCAKTYPTVAVAHPDAPALQVLAGVLRNGFLHRAIREQGGAYGGGASYQADTGAFHFYSYRDPRLTETLADFDAAIDWLATARHPERALEEAILGVIQAIDKPSSPAGECIANDYAMRFGRSAAFRQQFRSAILQVSFEDLVRVAQHYLQPQYATIGVLGSQDILRNAGFDVRQL